MYIKNMFAKDIDRDIKGVIKVGQKDDENINNLYNEKIYCTSCTSWSDDPVLRFHDHLFN